MTTENCDKSVVLAALTALKTSLRADSVMSEKLTDLMGGFWLFKVHWLLIELLSTCEQLTADESPVVTQRRRLGAGPAH